LGAAMALVAVAAAKESARAILIVLDIFELLSSVRKSGVSSGVSFRTRQLSDGGHIGSSQQEVPLDYRKYSTRKSTDISALMRRHNELNVA
jgi:hypothetical protein